MFCLNSSCKESWVLSQLVWVIHGPAQKWRGFGHLIWVLWARMVQELCVGVLACKNCPCANQAVPAVRFLGLSRTGHTCCLLLSGRGTCPRVACWTQTTFLPRVLLHIVSKCHEEGLDHYLRSFLKVSGDTAPGHSLLGAAQADSALLASVRLSSREAKCQAGEDDPWDPGAFHGHHLEAVSRFSSHQ